MIEKILMGLVSTAIVIVDFWGVFTVLQELGVHAALLVIGLTAIISVIIFCTFTSTTYKHTL